MTGPETLVVKGRVWEPVLLPLAQGPATGYAWLLGLPRGVHQLEDAPSEPVPAGRRLGGAEGGHLRVAADAPGTYAITARLARPWEPEAPIQVVQIQLVVD